MSFGGNMFGGHGGAMRNNLAFPRFGGEGGDAGYSGGTAAAGQGAAATLQNGQIGYPGANGQPGMSTGPLRVAPGMTTGPLQDTNPGGPTSTPLPILHHPSPTGGSPIAPPSGPNNIPNPGPPGGGPLTPLPILHHNPGGAAPPYTAQWPTPGGQQAPSQTVQQLPQGTATQPGNIAATAPMPYQAFGPTAQIDPSFANPQDQQAYFQQYAQMLQQSMNPYFTQQQQQLNADLRSRGIQDSGAAGYLEGNLLGQQGATLAGQEAPFLSQAFGYTNQDVLANQNAANEAALYNANAYQEGVNKNYDAYNNYLQQLLGLGGSDYGALQGAYLNSFGPSTGVQSGYNSALSGMQNVYGGVYGNALAAQQQQMQQLGQFAAMSGG